MNMILEATWEWDGIRMKEKYRIDIEARGRWEAPVTITPRHSELRGLFLGISEIHVSI